MIQLITFGLNFCVFAFGWVDWIMRWPNWKGTRFKQNHQWTASLFFKRIDISIFLTLKEAKIIEWLVAFKTSLNYELGFVLVFQIFHHHISAAQNCEFVICWSFTSNKKFSFAQIIIIILLKSFCYGYLVKPLP